MFNCRINKVVSNDLTGKGCYAAADLSEAVPGDKVNVSVHLEPGCKVYGVYDTPIQAERFFSVSYRSLDTGRLEQLPLTVTDDTHFSFIMPSDIDPRDRAVTVKVVFDEMDDPVRVSFSAGSGSGETADVILERGSTFILPACAFTAPGETSFDGWQVLTGTDSAVKAPGDEITVTAPTTTARPPRP